MFKAGRAAAPGAAAAGADSGGSDWRQQQRWEGDGLDAGGQQDGGEAGDVDDGGGGWGGEQGEELASPTAGALRAGGGGAAAAFSNAGAPAPGRSLDELAAAARSGLPEQQARLAKLRRAHAVAAKRLEWAQRRPATYAGELAMTAHQRSVRGAMRVGLVGSRDACRVILANLQPADAAHE